MNICHALLPWPTLSSDQTNLAHNLFGCGRSKILMHTAAVPEESRVVQTLCFGVAQLLDCALPNAIIFESQLHFDILQITPATCGKIIDSDRSSSLDPQFQSIRPSFRVIPPSRPTAIQNHPKLAKRCIWRPTWTPRAWPTAPPPSRCSAWRSPAGGPCWCGAAQRPGSEVPKKGGFTQETQGFQ